MTEPGAPTGESVTAPEPLGSHHDTSAFDCGEVVLDDWLKKRATANEDAGASRTYVVFAGGRVVGYYALANGSVAVASATGRVRRNMPDPIPVMVIGRLAVDRAWQRHGVGPSLLRDAILRTLQAAEIAGIRAILVHAVSDRAKAFYERAGFVASPMNPMTLMISIQDAVNAFR
jgi:GNAT superfamily N-acetyltransferase